MQLVLGVVMLKQEKGPNTNSWHFVCCQINIFLQTKRHKLSEKRPQSRNLSPRSCQQIPFPPWLSLKVTSRHLRASELTNSEPETAGNRFPWKHTFLNTGVIRERGGGHREGDICGRKNTPIALCWNPMHTRMSFYQLLYFLRGKPCRMHLEKLGNAQKLSLFDSYNQLKAR